ncbi:MAG: FAD-dependent oxidoreductase [Candidatus Eremiobacteraeota bacterium]|nr:FAD-dependent oxidoreductase [Candidatus Eremiobacteraeota bacterium]
MRIHSAPRRLSHTQSPIPSDCRSCEQSSEVVSEQKPEPPKRNLVPCHQWLSDKDPYTPPGPLPEPDQWKAIEHFDVAVVGAGMSGLNAAWKLQEGGSKVGLFERTRHAGGRVRSLKIENEKSIDLGAMRYIPNRHKRLANIVENVLKLPTNEFVVGGEKNLQYFRGVRMTNGEVAAHPEKRPYNLTEEEKGKSVDELLSLAISKIVPNFNELSEAEWDKVKKETTVSVTDPATCEVSAVPLHQLGLRNVLGMTLSHEAQNLLTDSVGYETFLANWDAGEALEELSADFRPGTRYRTPVDGMAAIPLGVTRMYSQLGGEFRSQHTLRRVEYDREHGFLLEFSDRKGNRQLATADKVVLGLPKTPLKELVEASPDLQSPQLTSNLEKVTPNPMTRIFATYPEAWWNDQGIEAGRSLTDMPLSQVYYYGNNNDQRPYIMAYSDGKDSDFWRTFQDPTEPGIDKRLCVKPQLAEELHRQMEELHGRKLPKPDGFLYKRWGSEYMGGAYHTWNPGSKPWETTEQMIQPDQEMPLYVCGEAFSTQQGWIEGALETSEKVLAEIARDSVEPPPEQPPQS